MPVAHHTSTSLDLQRVCRAPLLRFYISAARPTRYFHASISNTPAGHFENTLPPYLHIATPTTLLQRSIPPCLHFATPAARFQSSKAPHFHAFTSPRLQRASRPSFLHTYMSTSLGTPPALHTPVPPRLHACGASLELHASIPPIYRVACLQDFFTSKRAYVHLLCHFPAFRLPCCA